MTIYGTALLSLCLIIGLSLGRMLGSWCGIDSDIGGVGIAMLLLILGTDWLHRTGRMKPPTDEGIKFWGSIYVPVVVAMAATQNVRGALGGSLMAITAGALGVVACFILVGVFVRIGGNQQGKEDSR
jgi:malonate transporter MadL subunit